MTLNNLQILIVADEPDTAAMLATHIMTNLDANVSVVDTIEEAQLMAASEAFDLILAQERLGDGTAIGLAGDSESAPVTPLVIVAPEADVERVRSAFRDGAADVLDSAADGESVLACIDRVVRRCRQNQSRTRRSHRLRRVSTRLIKDRRELRQRVDLICRDVVDAYRRLAEKVVTAPNGGEGDQGGSPNGDQPLRRSARPVAEEE